MKNNHAVIIRVESVFIEDLIWWVFWVWPLASPERLLLPQTTLYIFLVLVSYQIYCFICSCSLIKM